MEYIMPDVSGAVIMNNDLVYNNIAIGYEANLNNGAGGERCIAIGVAALKAAASSNSDNNVAIGYNALTSCSNGSDNTVIGTWACQGINNSYNTAVGKNAMFYNNGSCNTAIGHSTLNGSSSGTMSASYNTAAGYDALKYVTTGHNNIGIGQAAVSGQVAVPVSITGDENIGIGKNALRSVCDGSRNIAIGSSALIDCSGGYNTAIGFEAGMYSDDSTSPLSGLQGSNNLLLGNGAGNNQIGVGTDNYIYLGNTDIEKIFCAQNSIDSLSDKRDKKNIIDIPYGLELINNLQPRQFTWDMRGETENNPHQGTTRVGFIAQEVQTVLGQDNNVLNMVTNTNPERLTMSYGQLVPVLTKAVQELSSQLTAEKEKTAILESKLTAIEARLSALESN